MTESPRALDSALQYTIGWIAPLFIERATAEALFDEAHAKPIDFDQPTSDPVSYSWGSIADHNIVLASLKAGIYGTNSAVSLATSMLRSFPEIRFGLLVGIGGAVPREGYDIRLGDIVVSQPSENSGGIIQYDLLRAKMGGQRERKDFLNSPPEVLLYALANLESQHEQAPPRVSEFLKELETRKPYMFRTRPNFPRYKHQGHMNDRLFQPTYEHVGAGDCRDCAEEQEVIREPRDYIDSGIHHGVIASGNTLVKDASAREYLLRHILDNCICYEMDAAGLMNSFPCPVIRGITRNIDAKATDALKTTLAQNVMTWLSPPDTSTIYHRSKGERHTGSCTWFLRSHAFQAWKRSPASCLWLHGLPGSGKTVLSSAIIQYLTEVAEKSESTVLYFYFDFNSPSNHNLDALARALTHQLYSLSKDAEDGLVELYRACGKGQKQPEAEPLLETFLLMTNKTKNVRVVLDALNGIKEDKESQKILSWIAKIDG